MHKINYEVRVGSPERVPWHAKEGDGGDGGEWKCEGCKAVAEDRCHVTFAPPGIPEARLVGVSFYVCPGCALKLATGTADSIESKEAA